MKHIASAAALAAALVLVPATAFAASGPDPAAPQPSDIAAAQAAASSATTRTTLGKFFGAKGKSPRDAKSAAAVPPVEAEVGTQTVAVYDLDPAFVAGRSPQPGRFAFLATGARAADGQKASVWTTRDQRGSWVVSNIASGDDEQRYAGQAGAPFREPQINAWYAVRDGLVVPLNDEATGSVGAAGVPVADYQRLVQSRYGDKLPGSAYGRDGYAGGYGGYTDKGTGLPGGLAMAGALVLLAGGGVLTVRRLRRTS
ncbi:hypothetical protein OIE66_23440 [Nonomuraea sp. NBC_01738]|uniref:hypothetical protein n=1 Tax=Nonomuraea sp. NBC_01738 TaxID=2976003 RepID=UPI002E1619AF|nr:hypothetical protein OIE66_23440 [Nonomuraea sp. NBC_01738]